MLRWRLLAAAVIVTPLLGLFYLDANHNGGVPGAYLIPVGWLLAVLAAAEVLALLAPDAPRPAAWVVLTGVSLVFLSGLRPALRFALGQAPLDAAHIGPLGWPTAAVLVSTVLVFVTEMLRFREPGESLRRMSLAIFVIIYPGLFLALLASLRFLHSNAWGMAALISLVFVTKLADTSAYAAGKLLGRRKMSPLLSPGKTVEGALGGLLGAAVAAWVYFQFLVPQFLPSDGPATPWWGCWLYGLIVGSAGMVGDLAESLLKRDMRRKDSSDWLPGLGGVLDVLDSVLLAGPAALLCWLLGLVGPPA